MPDHVDILDIPAGQLLFEEGDTGDCAYLVEEGLVEVFTRRNGQPLLLGNLQPGALLGEIALIDDAPRSASARAVTDSRLRVIRKEQLQERLAQIDPVLGMIMRLLVERYRRAMKAIKKDIPIDELLFAPVEQQDHATQAAIDRVRLEAELRTAAREDQLTIHYQPIIDLATDHWAGFEALVRWSHPGKGMVSPAEFIPLAEETMLVGEIGDSVIRQVVRDFAMIQSAYHKLHGEDADLFMGINISARQIDHHSGLASLEEIIRKTDLEPRFFKLEITETQVAEEDNIIRWTKEARRRGFTIALDDFGTGYSSLFKLVQLDIDVLKIDQSFVRTMLDDEDNLTLVKRIVSLAHTFDMKIIAEGIETDPQRLILTQLDCQYGQGFGLAKPMPVAEVIDALYSELPDGAGKNS
jgi:EAL domain-containing protein (putative c-di-GMP-specific phosphodiesterase class I)